MMKKILLFLIILLSVVVIAAPALASEETFKAKVIKVQDEVTKTREDGSEYLQQNLTLEGLEGDMEGKKFEYEGILELEVLQVQEYSEGDKVFVNSYEDIEGQTHYSIINYARDTQIWWLFALLVLVVVAVVGWKGLRSLIGLTISFLIIIKFLVPQILSGANPLLISIVGALGILIVMIYLTEGWNRNSHIAILSIAICLVLVGILSIVFTKMLHLSGFASDEILALVTMGATNINFEGLLLAGILIGTLGALDDVVLSQIETVEQIRQANPNLDKKELFKRASKVGNTHAGAMINTLFLAYAGASLPLLLLFSIKTEPFLGLSHILSHEAIAIEITRSVVGSIGLILIMPIATILAINLYKKK